MRTSILTSGFVAATVVSAITPKSEGNPPGAIYRAEFDFVDQTGVGGFFEVKPGQNGKGVELNFQFSGISMKTGNGPFDYGVYEKAVSGRDCNDAGVVFDPYETGGVSCKEGAYEDCQVGNVSGKQRPIEVEADVNSNSFIDTEMSTDPNNKAFIGDKSIVISMYNGTRVACGNFQSTKAPGGVATATLSGGVGKPTAGINGTGVSSGKPSGPGKPGSGPEQFTGSGNQIVAGFGAMVMAAAAMVL